MAAFAVASCSSSLHEEKVTLDYEGETKLVLDIPAEHRHELREAMEKSNTPIIINGYPANVRFANEENLNRWAIVIKTQDGRYLTSCLYNNMPFSIDGYYNFEHILTEQDASAIRIYIPSWKK